LDGAFNADKTSTEKEPRGPALGSPIFDTEHSGFLLRQVIP
jgi:hypothetical protein